MRERLNFFKWRRKWALPAVENEASSVPLPRKKVEPGSSVSEQAGQAGKWRFFLFVCGQQRRRRQHSVSGWICLHKSRYLVTARSQRWPRSTSRTFGNEATARTGDLVEKMHLFIKIEPFPHQMLNHRGAAALGKGERIRRKEAESCECVR